MGRKIVVRADDVGYSDVYDLGVFDAIDHGVVTAVDVMLDSPAADRSLERLRKYPWLSVGWHLHFWNEPRLGAGKVPSLVGSNGRFRKDLRTAMDASEEELYAELSWEVENCIRCLGRAPDTGESIFPDMKYPFDRAMRRVCEEFHIPYNYSRRVTGNPDGSFTISDEAGSRDKLFQEPCDQRWLDAQLYMANPVCTAPETLCDSLREFSATYDPVKFYTEDRCHLFDLPENATLGNGWHPGYLDREVYYGGDIDSPIHINFMLSRIVDIEALCSQRMKDWIRENHIVLVNFRDALYGTNDYQTHLRDIGSNLCML